MTSGNNRARTHKGLLFGLLLGFWIGVALSYAPRLWGA
ncbi:hypothetical protein [Azospirillum argentinense]